jgi:hypothetical protein
VLISQMYNGSLLQLLSSVYPDYDWLPWKFEERLQNYWENANNQRKFMEIASKKFDIKELSDWYKISRKVTLPIYKSTKNFSKL